MKTMEVQPEVSERSTDCIGAIWVLLCIKNLELLGMMELRNQPWLIRNQHHWGETYDLLGQGVYMISWAEEQAVINKRLVLLRWSVLGSILPELTCRNCGTGVSRMNLSACKSAWHWCWRHKRYKSEGVMENSWGLAPRGRVRGQKSITKV